MVDEIDDVIGVARYGCVGLRARIAVLGAGFVGALAATRTAVTAVITRGGKAHP